MKTWTGALDGEEWLTTIEVDCFSESEGFVVSIYTKHIDPVDGEMTTLVGATPTQAREMAVHLIATADNAEANQARVDAMSEEG